MVCVSTFLQEQQLGFEPGDTTDVKLVPFSGLRNAYGFNSLVNGSLNN